VASGPQQSGKGAGTVKRSTPKLKKESLANVMRLKAAMLKQANKSQDELQSADLLEAGAQRIEELEDRLRKRPAS
jgi:hypothetical protein